MKRWLCAVGHWFDARLKLRDTLVPMMRHPVPREIAGAILIGVDLGPNLSVTGSLATILWLTALRREGETVTAWQFLKLGTVVMIPALVLSIGALLLFH